jgi:hypothetical protein
LPPNLRTPRYKDRKLSTVAPFVAIILRPLHVVLHKLLHHHFEVRMGRKCGGCNGDALSFMLWKTPKTK